MLHEAFFYANRLQQGCCQTDIRMHVFALFVPSCCDKSKTSCYRTCWNNLLQVCCPHQSSQNMMITPLITTYSRLVNTRRNIVCQDMLVWKPGKHQSYKIEDLCLTLNCTSPCTNPLSQLH
jgi:hypothetical protein